MLSGEPKATETAIDNSAGNDDTAGIRPAATGDKSQMDRMLLQIDDTTHRLRRVGRLTRRRMRLEGAELANGTHTDGRVTVTISNLRPAAAGVPDTFDWEADRPIALVIVRAGIDGDDVSFQIGPATSGSGGGTLIGDGTGIRYIAFCYDAEPDAATVAAPARPTVVRMLRAGSAA